MPDPTAETPPVVAIDAAHIERQRRFSTETFGPGLRLGVIDHIRKELVEVEADPTDLGEWVDVIILGFDGAWRAGHEPQAIIDAIVAKQSRNEARVWPDWRTASSDKAIEHDRSADRPSAAVEPPAAPGAGTHTPEAHSGAEGLILGPALMDRDGEVWSVQERPIAEDYGPVREVLLVPVEAGPVLEAALRLVRAWDADPFSPQTAAAKAALGVAVDAATSRTGAAASVLDLPCTVDDCRQGRPCSDHDAPAPEPAGEEPLADWERELLGLEPEFATGGIVRGAPVQLDTGCVLPGVPFPVRVDSSVPPDTLLLVGTTEDEHGERKVTGAKLTGIGAPEPAGDGPGWDRCGIDHLIAMMDAHARTERGEMPVTVDDAAQLRALRAERDELAANGSWNETTVDQYRHALNAARAELAQVTNLLEDAYRSMTEAQRRRDAARAEVAQLRSELNEMTEARDEVRALLHEARAELVIERGTGRAIARRDGAADTLEWLRTMDDSRDKDEDLERLAAEVRAGELEIPTRQDGDAS